MVDRKTIDQPVLKTCSQEAHDTGKNRLNAERL